MSVLLDRINGPEHRYGVASSLFPAGDRLIDVNGRPHDPVMRRLAIRGGPERRGGDFFSSRKTPRPHPLIRPASAESAVGE